MASTNKEIMEAMAVLSDAMINLTHLWNDVTDEQDNALGSKYPFAESFDDVVNNVTEWAEEVGTLLKEKS
ncbi:hypothetical protein D3C81_96200 [compost metagenome]